MDEPRVPTDGDASDVVARARVVARLRARVDELEERLATSVLRERAKGALMAREGLSARQADATLVRRAEERGRTVADECWAVLGTTRGDRAGTAVGLVPGTAGPSDAVPPSGAAPDVLARVLLEVLRGPAGVVGVLVCGAAPDGGSVLLGHAGMDEPPAIGPAATAVVRGGRPVCLDSLFRSCQLLGGAAQL
ncbi:ANTAR domain-containing protein, partial [Streptomyces thermolilacinus]|uniref:ANTAR domain-containing protein n=1 Tax=Streptomyces thermolilacinus TaxID=285540 RepID=UPI0033FDBF4A